MSSLTETLSDVRRALSRIASLSMVVNVLMLAGPLYMMQVYDRVLITSNIDTLVLLSALVAAAYLTMALVDSARARAQAKIAEWYSLKNTPEALSTAISASRHVGANQAQTLRDLETIKMVIAAPATAAVLDFPFIPIFGLVLYILHPWFGIAGFAGGLILVIMALINHRLSKKAEQAKQDGHQAAMSLADQATRQADTVLGMGMHPVISDRVSKQLQHAVDKSDGYGSRTSFITSATKAFRMLLQSALLGIGAYLVIHQELSAGLMIAGSIIGGRALAPLEQAIQGWSMFSRGSEAYKRLKKISEAVGKPEGETLPPEPKGQISADKLYYVPPQQTKPVLQNISFLLNPGEAMAIIGPSGAGKSTVAKLIVGALAPSTGATRLDGAAVTDLPADYRGQYIGYLAQDTPIFVGSIRDNIARFNPEVSDDMVTAAAQKVGVHDMILHLPSGYDTPVGPGGVTLSGGQAQRVGLARAVLGAPKLLVLDEPDANLDSAGEVGLRQLLSTTKEQGTTMVMVTHRRGMLELVDKVLYLEPGGNGMFGERDKVLAELAQKNRGAA